MLDEKQLQWHTNIMTKTNDITNEYQYYDIPNEYQYYDITNEYQYYDIPNEYHNHSYIYCSEPERAPH